MINTNTAEILGVRYLVEEAFGSRQFYLFCANKPLKNTPYLRFDIPNFKLYSSVYRTLHRKWSF